MSANALSPVDAALEYLAHGYPITVCRGKHPMGDGWETDARGNWGSSWQTKTWTPAEVERAFQQFGDCNVGIQWGPRSGLVDIEADTAEQEQAFAALFDGCDIPVTPTFQSTRGKHRLFSYDPRLAATGKAVVEFRHLGIRIGTNGKAAHSVVPPSANREWLVSLAECDPAPLPDVVIQRILAANQTNSNSDRKSEPLNGHAIPDGKRNETLTKIAGSLRRIGLSETEMAAALMAVNQSRCVTPLSATEVHSIARSIGRYSPAEADQTQPPMAFERLSCRQLDEAEFQTEFLIDWTLVAGQPCIFAGSKKTLKTTLLVSLALSLATGQDFLGKLRVRRCANTLIMSGESGMGTLQETARRIAESLGKSLSDIDGLYWCDKLPLFAHLEQVDAFEALLKGDEIEVAIIDPAYLCMEGEDAGNLFIQGKTLRMFNEVCQRNGVTLVIAHHTRKNVADPFEPPELENIAWAGFQEWCRQWLLVGRREKYEPGTGNHRLWLNVGGSAGHSSLWALDIDEGQLPKRHWHVEVMHADEAREQVTERREEAKQEKANEKIEHTKQRIVKAMGKYPKGETEKVIKDTAGVSGTLAKLAFSALLQDGDIEPCEVTKRCRKTPFEGYKLSDRPD